MYVCLCHGITDKQIRQAAEQGASCMSQIKRELAVATQCGKCACHAKALLKQSLDCDESQFKAA